jgi:hypothetical protein
MDRTGSTVVYSSELDPGFTAGTAFMATLTTAMILVKVTGDRFHSVGSSHSITFMLTKRETAKVMWAVLAMKAAANTAPELRGDVVAAVTVR